MTDKTKTASSFSRRGLLKTALATGALAAALPAFAQTPGRKPNFLFIMADDLGYADLSVYGRRDYETPVLDRLAAQGTRFTHAYANSAVCSATRVGLITGRYQYRLPVGLVEPLSKNAGVGLPPSHPTLPSLLQDVGYYTALIGKWHLGELPTYGPLKSGYDEFWGIRQGGVDYFTHKIYGEEDLWDGETLIEESGYLTELLFDKTVETLEERSRQDEPWLISLHLTAPHWPWEGPNDGDIAERLDEKVDPAGMAILHYDGGNLETYAEMVTYMDAQIGRVLEKLEELGMADDTVVVFTSDNGGERFSDTWPFTGKKTELLEGGIRIPAIVRWPGLATPGTVSDTPIMSMDWLPTFLAAAGGAPHPQFPSDGVDVRAAISGRQMADRPLFWKYKNHGQQAARLGKWKYLKIAGNTFLFDVVADPLERGNLKQREPEVYAEMVGAWERWNAGMLVHPEETNSSGFSGANLADHFGAGS
ncbi:sulfatase family protein [Altericroceibacterium xinjiangense]|uniref:sulfatase family protein n=1 Tax=Altericroceibacterium xinjiangense TaxID=762261 RepID=UPI000F7E9920|nr:sulfatase-like hydrolase/transferase [Altericroceibacterium xinjiangense]